MPAEEAINNIAEKSSSVVLDQGVTGVMLILFIGLFGVMLWQMLREKDTQKQFINAVDQMNKNAEKQAEQYRTSQEHHDKVLHIVADNHSIERQNTKDCYEKTHDRLDENSKKLDQLLLTQKVVNA